MKPFLAISLCLLSGCGGLLPNQVSSGSDPKAGLAVVVPGIEGEMLFDQQIRDGLRQANVPSSITIYHWGWPVPLLGMAMNQTDLIGNRINGDRLAKFVAAYQQKHPDAPIYIIGRSAGAALAVFAAESFPKYAPYNAKVEGIILLSASLSADYNLITALSHCRKGIVCFYNTDDIAILEMSTAVWGNIDGGHGSSAGRTGFASPSLKGRDAQYDRLYQVHVTPDMVDEFLDPHFANSTDAFVRVHVSPWLKGNAWPLPKTNGR
jgi:pimeloyl-ACP methyl ester carboxylesterase